MKILVIGGTKFVGLRLVWELHRRGYDLTLLNRGKTEAKLPNNIRRLYADRREHDKIKQVLSGQTFDATFDITGYFPADVKATIKALKGKTKHYIFCSTASVYRKTEVFPIKENFPTFTEQFKEDAMYSDYGYNKTQCEQVLFDQTDFAATIIRPMYIYGPFNPIYRERYFFDRILREHPILIPNKFKNITQFGHVDDLARAFCQTLKNEKTFGKAYNISGEEFITLDGLTEKIAKAMDKEASIIRYSAELTRDIKFDYNNPIFPFDWTNNFFEDISAAKEDLDWQSEYNLISGMKNTFEWYLEKDLDKVEPNLELDNLILTKLEK